MGRETLVNDDSIVKYMGVQKFEWVPGSESQ